MVLKSVVDRLLKERSRSLTWLAEEMGKTFDGLKLSLTRGSIKYNDLVVMAKILEVTPQVFFDNGPEPYQTRKTSGILSEPQPEYSDLKNNLKNCREMLSTLKDQIKDKDKIITLLSKKEG